MVLWYLANENCFRDMCDKFCISKSTAHRFTVAMVDEICTLVPQCIKWWDGPEKICSSQKFQGQTGLTDIIGAIDGCHIPIKCSPKHGDDYLNRKG